MLRLSISVIVLAACGGSAVPSATAPPIRDITTVADLAGDWEATDLDGWTYQLTIDDTRFLLLVARPRGGECRQEGNVQPYQAAYGAPYDPRQWGGASGATPGADKVPFAMVITLQRNDCNRDYAGAQLITLATDFTGDEVTLRLETGWGGPQELRRYRRVAPRSGPPAPGPLAP